MRTREDAERVVELCEERDRLRTAAAAGWDVWKEPWPRWLQPYQSQDCAAW